MRPITLFPALFFLILSFGSFSQDQVPDDSKSGKRSQADLFNDVYAGYGAGGLFYWTGRMNHSSDYPSEVSSWHQTFTSPKSAGTFMLGYQRTLNPVISVGMLFGIQNFTYTGSGYEYIYSGGYYNDTIYHSGTYNDLLVMGIARVNFSYVNKGSVRMYSGIGIGLTVDFGTATDNGKDYNERKLFPAGQFTLMGVRFGRAFGGFFEFGIGTYGIINAGISYKFSDGE